MKLLHSDATEGAYRLVHASVFLIWVLTVAMDPLHKLAAFPVTAFEPYGPLRFVPAETYAFILEPSVLTALRIGAVVCCVSALLRPAAVWAQLGACLLLTLHQTVVRGFSVMNHAEIVALQAVYVFTAFALLDRFTPGEKKEQASTPSRSYALVTLTLLFALTYFFAGLNRTIAGLGGIWDGSALVYFVQSSVYARGFSFDFSRRLLDHPELLPVLNTMFLVVTLAELATPLCLISARARRIVVPTLVSFHLLAFVLMKVIFWPHALLLILLSDISAWSRKLLQHGPRRWRGALPAS
jgi:hypothetical protein